MWSVVLGVANNFFIKRAGLLLLFAENGGLCIEFALLKVASDYIERGRAATGICFSA